MYSVLCVISKLLLLVSFQLYFKFCTAMISLLMVARVSEKCAKLFFPDKEKLGISRLVGEIWKGFFREKPGYFKINDCRSIGNIFGIIHAPGDCNSLVL